MQIECITTIIKAITEVFRLTLFPPNIVFTITAYRIDTDIAMQMNSHSTPDMLSYPQEAAVVRAAGKFIEAFVFERTRLCTE
jgi:hypothetical protein